MPAFVDLTGQVYGRLTVVGHGGRIVGRHAWECKCTCGRAAVVASHCLRSGNSRSCGCLNDEVRSAMTAARNRANKGRVLWELHGHGSKRNGRSPTYQSWRAMSARIDHPSERDACYVGVSICDRWRDFRNFLADMGERPDGMTLDRENPFGNYEPGNCRWATRSTQSKNTRVNWLKEHNAAPDGATA